MLKLTYTEFGLHLEQLATPFEVVVTQRALLAVRLGQTLHIESSRASFLLPAHTPLLSDLEQILTTVSQASIALASVDADFVEVSIQGSWIAASAEAYEGTFIATFPDRLEILLYQLWQASQPQVSSLV